MDKLVQSAYFSNNTIQRKAHYHDCHQIILIVKGQIEFCVNEATRQAGAGDIVMFSRYENHAVTILSEQYERYVLRIDPSVDSRENRLYSLLSNRPSGFCNILDVSGEMEDFERLFRRITEEVGAKLPLSSDLLELLINELLIRICRQIPDALALLEDARFDMVADIRRRFENHPAGAYSLDGLAREYHLSASSLSHLFKKITGSSVMGYLLSCRMAAAKRYLTQSRLSVGEIVERCGFSDSSNFSRTFKNLTGLAPSAFRKKYQQS